MVIAVVTRLRLADPDAFARWAPRSAGVRRALREQARARVILVTAQNVVEVDGEEWAGAEHSNALELSEDMTSALLALAEERREGRGDDLGDLRRAGHDIGRFAFYAAPTRIELDAALAERLDGRVDL